MDAITINFTSPITTPYQVIVEYYDTTASGGSSLIHVPIMTSKGASTLVFQIWEAVPGTQSSTIKVVVLDTTKV